MSYLFKLCELCLFRRKPQMSHWAGTLKKKKKKKKGKFCFCLSAFSYVMPNSEEVTSVVFHKEL